MREIRYWAATDVGRKRTDNEDNFLVDADMRLFVVADGMGGHASGEVASAICVHTIRDIVAQNRDILEIVKDDDPATHVEVCTLLEHAVHTACDFIYTKGQREPEKRGMGTTVVVLMLIGTRGYIAYVGDSRIYLLRGGIVYQLTEDHSLMNELIRQGKITAEEFDDSPYADFKNAMTRAVGPQEQVEVDTMDFDMVPGDAFLLCSDGLYEYLEDEDIARVLALPEVAEIPGQFVDMANTGGGKDNITAVVIHVPVSAEDGDQAAQLSLTIDTLKRVPLFAQLSYRQLIRLMNLTSVFDFEQGDHICVEGDEADHLYILLRGSVELTVQGVRVATLDEGSHFGEMALLDASPRSATATALESGKVLTLARQDFFEVLRKEAGLAVKLLWSFLNTLGDRLRDTNRQLKTASSAAAASGIEDLSEELELSDAEVVEEITEVEALEEVAPEAQVDEEDGMGEMDEVTDVEIKLSALGPPRRSETRPDRRLDDRATSRFKREKPSVSLEPVPEIPTLVAPGTPDPAKPATPVTPNKKDGGGAAEWKPVADDDEPSSP